MSSYWVKPSEILIGCFFGVCGRRIENLLVDVSMSGNVDEIYLVLGLVAEKEKCIVANSIHMIVMRELSICTNMTFYRSDS